MALDQTVEDQMKSTRTLTDRVSTYVPVYRGYRTKNLRRDEDRAIREEVVRTLEGAKADLATVQRAALGNPDLMRDLERIRSKTDRYTMGIKKAINGYGGVWASMKVEEQELSQVVEWDARLVEEAATIRKEASELVEYIDSGGLDLKKPLREFERSVDAMMENFSERNKVIKGLAGTEDVPE
ncbi:MAG: hypothetical protein RBQ77_00035 [Candidatus Methanomethylophilaceae archaeon]|jgi:uncharacterized protein (UPF0335 family)|nr:hypothetical protein [Candidatus Methanomethylophilaceae archaeon]NLF34060.1 hypothetical protein [Thermoplasmatales archaeon]